jgi:hypothetical protein
VRLPIGPTILLPLSTEPLLSQTRQAQLLLTKNVLNVGYSSNFAALYLNGHIRSIRYYPARLNNAQLQTLTA